MDQPEVGDGIIDTPEEVLDEVEGLLAVSQATNEPVEARDIPDPLRFRVIVQVKGLLLGVLLDLAIEVLFQQFGIAVFEMAAFLRAIALGTAIGIFMPTLGHSVGVVMANREIRRLKAELKGVAA